MVTQIRVSWKRCLACLVLSCLAGLMPVMAAGERGDLKAGGEDLQRLAGVSGGLCVHLGSGDGILISEMAAGGKFIVHGLEPDAMTSDAAQRLIRARGLYGLAWVEHYGSRELPYSENLVNLVVAGDLPRTGVTIREILRVLVPGGVALLRQDRDSGKNDGLLREEGIKDAPYVQATNGWLRIQKPWPSTMDDWGHPRHGADGNAASRDELAGPPRRIRWVHGPWHEASNMAVAGGKFFHSGLIARDAFNGLRLWEQTMTPSPKRMGFSGASQTGSILPIASRDRLFVISNKQLTAFDSTSGKTLMTYPDAGVPLNVLCDSGMLVASTRTSMKAFDAVSGKLLWTVRGADIGEPVACVDGVFFLEGDIKKGAKRSIVALDRATGVERWRRNEYPWTDKTRRLSCGDGMVICEVSTFGDNKPGCNTNSVVVLSAADGSFRWEWSYVPGMTHFMQARAIRTAGLIWIHDNTNWLGLDVENGRQLRKIPSGAGHCFPPVGTARFLIAGEMSFSDIAAGKLDANRITKGNCSREMGFLPANGLVYVSPKHCACWPMLRGYSALAPANALHDQFAKKDLVASDFVMEHGPAFGKAQAGAGRAVPVNDQWPGYRADAWRSGSSKTAVPAGLDVLWSAQLGGWPQGPMTNDWRDNIHSHGVLTPPVVSDGIAVVARPEAHQVMAFDAVTGQQRWEFTANGRIDTPPTLFEGMCLFGTRSGWVYCLQASDGVLVWRLRAAPYEERIVAFGQLESPWPVPGSVLVVNGIAYFAAGRQPMADGGILIFAVVPATGKIVWVKRLNTVPMTSFYGSVALEFDPFDLLVLENDRPVRADINSPTNRQEFVAMSRWRFAPGTGDMTVVPKSGFGYFQTGDAGVMVPRGVWTYGPRMDYSWMPESVSATLRPLAVFRENLLVGSSEDGLQLFCKEFSPESIAQFNDNWYTIGQVPRKKADKGDHDRNERAARDAKWTTNVFAAASKSQSIGALVLAGDTIFAAGQEGQLFAFSAADGRKLMERDLPAPIWDGMVAAQGKLYVTTRNGGLLCLGKK